MSNRAALSCCTPSHLTARAVDVGDITGLVLYGVLWVVTVLAALRHLHRSMQDEPEDGRPRSWTVAGIFYALALSFVSVRVAWFALVLTTVHSFVQYSLNVIADLLFFSCFSLIVLHWSDENFSSTVGGSRGVSVTLARTLLAVNAVLYGFQLAVLTYINVNQYQTNPVLLVVSLSVAVFDNCLCAIGFLIFALRLWCSPSATHDTAVSGGMRRKIYLLLVVALVMTACFVARCVRAFFLASSFFDAVLLSDLSSTHCRWPARKCASTTCSTLTILFG